MSVHVQQLSPDGLSNDKSQVEEISDILQWKLSKSVSNINIDLDAPKSRHRHRQISAALVIAIVVYVETIR